MWAHDGYLGVADALDHRQALAATLQLHGLAPALMSRAAFWTVSSAETW